MKSTVAPYATTAWCVRIECTNGTVARLTTYPFDLTMSNATVYKTDSGYDASAYSATSNLSPSSIDIEGIAGVAGISKDQIAAGVFDDSRIFIFKCDYTSPVEDYEQVTAGFFGKATLIDGRYRIEGMSLVDALNQSVGMAYTAACSRTLGDAGCGVNLAAVSVSGALTGVTSQYVVRDSSRSEAADWFGAGTIRFTSGANVGLKALEIKIYASDGTITTHEPFYYVPQVGDTYVMEPGCRKRETDCRDKWNKLQTGFFGFVDIPTSSVIAQIGTN